jgi:hypothetical protein
MADAPRCPLGFTGTPPVGHPTIAGMFGSSDSKTATRSADAAPGAAAPSPQAQTQVPAAAAPRWSPYTLLTLDALFLVACGALAWYWPQVKSSSLNWSAAGGQHGLAGWW